MKNIMFLIMACVLFSCGNPQKSAQDAITASLEKAIGTKTGQKVDMGDASSYTENNGSLEYISDGKTYIKKDEKLQAVAIFQKDNDGLSIAFQLSGEVGKSLLAIVSHIPENFTLPLTGKFAVSNSYDGVNPVATMMLMELTENGATSVPMAFEGTLTITKLNAKEMLFEVDAKGGNANEADSPSTWKQIKATGLLKMPIIQSFGIDKVIVLK